MNFYKFRLSADSAARAVERLANFDDTTAYYTPKPKNHKDILRFREGPDSTVYVDTTMNRCDIHEILYMGCGIRIPVSCIEEVFDDEDIDA